MWHQPIVSWLTRLTVILYVYAANDIITLLLKFENIESLNLYHNSLTDKHADAICTLITNHPKLTSLNLSWYAAHSLANAQ